MKEVWIYLWIFAFVPIIISLIVTLIVFIRSPFKFPYQKITFDVSGTKQPKIEDYIDDLLIEEGIDSIDQRMLKMLDWKKESLEKIKKSAYKKRRQEQFESCLDWDRAFVFTFVRKRTRYKQVNYVRYPYTVIETVQENSCSYAYLKDRFDQLEEIGFEAVLSEYHAKNQRRLMTKELREHIAERDNYTCQICGKYMPDGVGLHIDHIIPVSKGGKSIPSNLRVLCSKCNGRKSNH